MFFCCILRLNKHKNIKETYLKPLRITWGMAVVPEFGDKFDGNGHMISNLQIYGGGYLGFFGICSFEATVARLGLEEVDVN